MLRSRWAIVNSFSDKNLNDGKRSVHPEHRITLWTSLNFIANDPWGPGWCSHSTRLLRSCMWDGRSKHTRSIHGRNISHPKIQGFCKFSRECIESDWITTMIRKIPAHLVTSWALSKRLQKLEKHAENQLKTSWFCLFCIISHHQITSINSLPPLLRPSFLTWSALRGYLQRTICICPSRTSQTRIPRWTGKAELCGRSFGGQHWPGSKKSNRGWGGGLITMVALRPN